jgi:hypothetical protein
MLDVGAAAFLQPACECQKQPWTKTTNRDDLRTKSGFPGKFTALRVNLILRERKTASQRCSALVPVERTDRMIWLRSDFEKVSDMEDRSS